VECRAVAVKAYKVYKRRLYVAVKARDLQTMKHLQHKERTWGFLPLHWSASFCCFLPLVEKCLNAARKKVVCT